MTLQPRWQRRLRDATKQFWGTRAFQANRQGAKTGERDAGNRTAVTGGKQMDGFVELAKEFLEECGVDRSCIFSSRPVELPGWFRAEKKWDLLAVVNGNLIAAMEFKSQVGSFGNNFNNRTEESLGSATDIWTAYREGVFALSQRPWLGYVMVLEEAAGSTSPVRVKEPHFPVLEEFREASYAKRYEIMMTKLLRERLYDGAALLMTSQMAGPEGLYREPNPELTIENLLKSLKAKVVSALG